MFEELKATIKRISPRKGGLKSWIREGTWGQIDRIASLCQQGKLTQAHGRKLRRRVKESLKEDRKKRIADAGSASKNFLMTES